MVLGGGTTTIEKRLDSLADGFSVVGDSVAHLAVAELTEVTECQVRQTL
jgi:hypothetical protein